jgi:pimeloyl-ACP methyl ester carboxylesterase
MWEPQLRSFAATHTVVRVDLPGFGNSPVESNPVSYRGAVAEALDAAGSDRAAVVGTSLGGRVALEVALDFPERVTALVLVGAGLDGHDWSQKVEAFGEAEEEALARGDLEAAVNLNVDLWVVGPHRKGDEIDPALLGLVAEMQRNAFRLGEGHDDLREVRLDPPASQRLGEVSVPTLVVTGDEDVEDIHVIAGQLANGIPGAQRATIAGAAHLPNLERPEEFDRIVLGFLAEHDV